MVFQKKKLLALLLGAVASSYAIENLPEDECSNWNGWDSCQGDQVDYSDENEARRFQTPPRDTELWHEEYQDMGQLQGYAHVEYSGDRRSATVDVRTFTKDASARLEYSFNGEVQYDSTFQVDEGMQSDLDIVVSATYFIDDNCTKETATLELDPVNFVWQNEPVHQPDSMENGQRGAIVELFGWPYADIEQECEDFLGKAGYMGVKVFPPQESVMSDTWPEEGTLNPWYYIYQPVSYRLHSRFGTREELRSMIQTCRANGVRVYADSVVNHMSGNGNSCNPTKRQGQGGWCNKWGSREGTGGSPYWTHGYQYEVSPWTNERPALEFPAVPYGPTDFHCERTLGSWSDGFSLNYGWLVGLTDLNTEKNYVRERIAQYWVDLLGIGFSGFRIDAAKHIRPDDLAAIFGKFNQFMGGSLPDDFTSWAEVILGGEAHLLACDDNDYNYYTYLDEKLYENGLSEEDVQKTKIWSSDYPKEHPACGYWKLPSERFAIQNDDHDQQSPGSSSRDMQGRGSVLVKDKDVDLHRHFEKELFTRGDGNWKLRMVLSSYTLPENGKGMPDGFSDCSRLDDSAGQECSHSVPYEPAFRAGSCGYTVEGFKGGKYTRVHRDLDIVNAMRGWLGLGHVSNGDLGISGC